MCRKSSYPDERVMDQAWRADRSRVCYVASFAGHSRSALFDRRIEWLLSNADQQTRARNRFAKMCRQSSLYGVQNLRG